MCVWFFLNSAKDWDRTVTIDVYGEPLSIRLMKFTLPNKDIAVFASSLLNTKEHPRRTLCDLYCQRWDIETAFREMKVWHGLENIKARYADGVHQEVAALMVYMTLAAELELQAYRHHNINLVSEKDNDIFVAEVRFNRKHISQCLNKLLVASSKDQKTFERTYQTCMHMLWRYRQKRRPGRMFKRKARSSNAKFRNTTRNTKKNDYN